jgi:hypothetical protein
VSRPVAAPVPTPARGIRAFAPAIAAGATIGLGYLDLARGGTTVSALLLVVGYAALVPWAIARSGRRGLGQQQ